MICVGEIINTHGLKGEVKVNSKFRYKHKIFQPKKNLFIEDVKAPVVIKKHRHHKNNDLLLFEKHEDINDVLIYKGSKIFVPREALPKDIIIPEDLIGFIVKYQAKEIGQIKHFFNNKAHDVLIIEGNQQHYLPYVNDLIKKIDLENKIVFVNEIEGIFDEN